jgi:hypothetical protein
LLGVERKSSDVIFKAIPNIEINIANDCFRVTLLHSIVVIDCNVFTFWHFHLEHLVIHHGGYYILENYLAL